MKNLKESLTNSFFSKQILQSKVFVLENIETNNFKNNKILSSLFFTKKTSKGIIFSTFFNTSILKFPLTFFYFQNYLELNSYILKLKSSSIIFMKINFNLITVNKICLKFFHIKKIFLVTNWLFNTIKIKI